MQSTRAGVGQVVLAAAAMGYRAAGVELDGRRHLRALVCAMHCV